MVNAQTSKFYKATINILINHFVDYKCERLPEKRYIIMELERAKTRMK